MASTWSDLKFELIGTGEQSGTWGTTTNANIGDAIEQAIGGKADVTMSSTSITISLTDTTALQDARALYLNLTGTPGGAATLNVPAVQKSYIVYNNTTGGFAVTVKVSGQTGVSVPNGKVMVLYDNGTDVVDAITHLSSLTLGSALAVASGGTGVATLTANNVVLGNGTSAVQFVAPGSVGNVLTSNGTTWTSSAPASTPGGSTTQVQYNNAGAFGGISNATTDGTTLSMTSPKVITGINDTNGNELLKVTATASAVNELTLANAATGGNPVLSATGGDTNIGITLTPKGTGGVVFPAGAVGTPAITTTGDTNTGVFFPAADTAAITTVGTERMRIDSDGNVGIGSTSPSTYGDSGGGPNVVVQSTGTGRGVLVFASQQTGGADEILGKINFIDSDSTNTAFRGAGILGVRGSDANSAYLLFNTANSGNGTERMRINSDGTIKTSSTISVGNATPSTSGCGITFPASENLSTNGNTLDDYEEGTWTPSIGGTATYQTQAGQYTKIGNIVILSGRLSINTRGTGSQSTVSGLPFTSASTTNNFQGSKGFFTNLAQTVVSLDPVVQSNASTITFNTLTAGATASLNSQNVIQDGTIIDFSITYRV